MQSSAVCGTEPSRSTSVNYNCPMLLTLGQVLGLVQLKAVALVPTEAACAPRASAQGKGNAVPLQVDAEVQGEAVAGVAQPWRQRQQAACACHSRRVVVALDAVPVARALTGGSSAGTCCLVIAALEICAAAATAPPSLP